MAYCLLVHSKPAVERNAGHTERAAEQSGDGREFLEQKYAPECRKNAVEELNGGNKRRMPVELLAENQRGAERNKNYRQIGKDGTGIDRCHAERLEESGKVQPENTAAAKTRK